MVVVRRGDDHLAAERDPLTDDRGIGGFETNAHREWDRSTIARRDRHQGRLATGLHVPARLSDLRGKGGNKLAERNELAERHGHVFGVASIFINPNPGLPHREPVLHSVALIEVCVTHQNRRPNRLGRFVDALGHPGKLQRVTVNGTLAPQRQVDRMGTHLPLAGQLHRRARVVARHLSLAPVGLRARERDVALYDADAQEALLRLIGQRDDSGRHVARERDGGQKRTREPALVPSSGVAVGEHPAHKNGDENDAACHDRGSAVGSEVSQRRIHLGQGYRAPRETRPRPARSRDLDPRPRQRVNGCLRERSAGPRPRLHPPDGDDPREEEQCLNKSQCKPRWARPNGERNPVEQRKPHAHPEGHGHRRGSGGPGLVDPREVQRERWDREPPPAHRRKGHVQRYSRHSCDQRIRARVGQGRPLQDFPMTH